MQVLKMGIALAENHYFLNNYQDMREIFAPFKDKLQIAHFTHRRYFFSDQSIQISTTHPSLVQHHLSKGYPILPNISPNLIQQAFCYLALQNNNNDRYNQAIHDYIHMFDIHFPFFLMEQKEHYLDIFAFSSTGGETFVINNLLNKISDLQNFKDYYLDVAETFVQKAKQHKLPVPIEMQPNLSQNSDFLSPNNLPHIEEGVSLYLEAKKQLINKKFPNAYLTSREVELLYFLSRGYCAKEVATLMGISPRTVSIYFSHIKDKMAGKKKSELLSFFY